MKALQDQVKKLTELAAKHKAELEDYKVSSRHAASLVQKQHAAVIVCKNAEIKAAKEEVCAYHDMLHEISAEVYSAKKPTTTSRKVLSSCNICHQSFVKYVVFQSLASKTFRFCQQNSGYIVFV